MAEKYDENFFRGKWSTEFVNSYNIFSDDIAMEYDIEKFVKVVYKWGKSLYKWRTMNPKCKKESVKNVLDE